MDKKSLLFVESPLQLLNANEAIDFFNLKNYKMIIRLSMKQENDAQIKKLVDILKIDNVEYIAIKTENRTLSDYLKILFFRYRYTAKKIDKVFIGNLESGFFRLIMKQFAKDKIVLLDDGSKTLAIQKKFSQNNFYNIFTMYDIQPISNQKVYKNEFATLITKLSTLKIDTKKILFIGSDISEIGIVKKDQYINYIKKIALIYSAKNIIYVTHRGESNSKLDEIKKIENITIRNYSYPIELMGIYEDAIPYKVVSFYSTALLTMKNIYKIEAECFSFDYSSSKHRDAIDEVYDYYSKYIEVLALDD